MAPQRSRKAAEADDNDDSSDQPKWDSSDRNIQLHLQSLKRWLPRQHSQFNNFIRYGYIINARQEVVVCDNDHKEQLLNGTLVPGLFEQPWQHSAAGDSSDEADSEDSTDSRASALHPLSAKKIKPKPTPTPTTKDTPLDADAATEKYRVAPRALTSFDEEVLETILETFEDQDTADDYRTECQGSAAKLISILHKLARKISTTDDTNIETRQENLYKQGISEPTVKAFNAFKSQYSAFNKARLVPKADHQLANDYVQVVRRLGEHIDVRLEGKLDYGRAHGKLHRTVKAIRLTLGTFESSKETAYLLTGKSAGAYLGRDPKKGLNLKVDTKPKKFDTSKPWKESDGPCPLKARGSGCDGKHWKKDCPNPNQIDTKAPPKSKKGTDVENNPLSGKSNLSRQEDNEQASHALFSGQAREVELESLSSAADLLQALTANEAGRSCMAHSHGHHSGEEDECPLAESSSDDSDASEDESEAATLSTITTLSDPTVHEPEIYVVGAPTNSSKTEPRTEGIYYGSWGYPDNLAQRFFQNERIVAVSNLEQAAEACEHFGAPTKFQGPRELDHLKPGMDALSPASKSSSPSQPPEHNRAALALATPARGSGATVNQVTPRSTPTDG